MKNQCYVICINMYIEFISCSHCVLFFRVGIEHTQGEGPGAYTSATISKAPIKEEPVKEPEPTPAAPSSDSDSD